MTLGPVDHLIAAAVLSDDRKRIDRLLTDMPSALSQSHLVLASELNRA